MLYMMGVYATAAERAHGGGCLSLLNHLADWCGVDAEVFTGSPGKYVELKDTVSGFKGLLEGQYDDLPEMAFYMVGDINEAIAKADELAKQVA